MRYIFNATFWQVDYKVMWGRKIGYTIFRLNSYDKIHEKLTLNKFHAVIRWECDIKVYKVYVRLDAFPSN